VRAAGQVPRPALPIRPPPDVRRTEPQRALAYPAAARRQTN
jgi:hypothetical protein